MNSVIQVGNSMVVPLAIELLNPATNIYAPTAPTTVTLVVTDPTGATSTYALNAGVVPTTTGNYYVIVPCNLVGQWTGTWTTTNPAGTLKTTWRVIP